MSNPTAKQVAEEEVKKEMFDEDKQEYKSKLKSLAAAEKVVTNIKLQIEDLDAKISERE